MAASDNLTETELEETFTRAAKYLATTIEGLSPDQLLQFYSLYKQGTDGPCNIPRPTWYQMLARRKWEAWAALGDMSRDVAMNSYIEAVTKLNPTWNEEYGNESHSWIAVSLPNREDEISDADKTFLDWVKEGNAEMVKEMLTKEAALANVRDELGLLPIHWAADRGHVTVMKALLENGANVDSQDGEGQTPLHYAAFCGHLDVVKYLLSDGAQSMEDNDGLKPKDIADAQLAAIL